MSMAGNKAKDKEKTNKPNKAKNKQTHKHEPNGKKAECKRTLILKIAAYKHWGKTKLHEWGYPTKLP